MREKYSNAVIAIAALVVEELQENITLKKYQHDLPKDELLTRVCGYVATLPPASQDRLLGNTQDERGESKIKGNGISQLADTIGRGFASYNKSGQYNDKEHGKAVYNFTILQQSKFNENVVSLGTEIVHGLTSGKKDLNYNQSLNPVFLSAILDPLSVERNDPKLQARIAGLTIGMIAKVAGQDSPFKEVLKKTNSLPPELVVAIHEAAVVLAQDPKYSTFDKDQAIEVGKVIGKQIRKEVAKTELDNMQLARKGETVDTKAVKDTIVTMVLGKGKSVDDLSAPVAVSAKQDKVDMRGLDSLAERLEGKQSRAIDSSSSSRSDGSNRSRRGSFTDKVLKDEAAALAAHSTGGKGSNIR